jgi:porphobilinogen synthase
MRRLVAETTLEPRQLILPMFVREDIDEPVPISSMPGVVQHTRRGRPWSRPLRWGSAG